MIGVGQDVSVQHVDELAVLVVGELPVGGPFGLGVAHRLEADTAVAGVGADPVGFLLAPVGQGIRSRVVGLVDEQEPAAAWVPQVDEAAFA